MFKRIFSIIVIATFFLTSLGPLPQANADTFLNLPAVGSMVLVSPNFQPALIKGLTVHQDNPFLFDFIVDPGQSKVSQEVLKDESDRMVKYFFASLTIPDQDIWVNLSPYEKDRMIPGSLGVTAMGRDLLAQDYMLKQLTASLIDPQKALGKTFWNRVYAKAQAMYGTTEIPVNTFNKVWIVPQKAGIYEHNQTAYIVNAHLKVMLEEDYLALNRHSEGVRSTTEESHSIASNIIRQIILPEIEKEINEGKSFSTLRQIFYAQVLAVWFKRNLKQALLNHVYSNKGTVKGIDQNNPTTNQRIYQQYLSAYKKGVFNFIKEDINPITKETLPRKYFSGGYSGLPSMAMVSMPLTNAAMRSISRCTIVSVMAGSPAMRSALVASGSNSEGIDPAMFAEALQWFHTGDLLLNIQRFGILGMTGAVVLSHMLFNVARKSKSLKLKRILYPLFKINVLHIAAAVTTALPALGITERDGGSLGQYGILFLVAAKAAGGFKGAGPFATDLVDMVNKVDRADDPRLLDLENFVGNGLRQDCFISDWPALLALVGLSYFPPVPVPFNELKLRDFLSVSGIVFKMLLPAVIIGGGINTGAKFAASERVNSAKRWKANNRVSPELVTVLANSEDLWGFQKDEWTLYEHGSSNGVRYKIFESQGSYSLKISVNENAPVETKYELSGFGGTPLASATFAGDNFGSKDDLPFKEDIIAALHAMGIDKADAAMSDAEVKANVVDPNKKGYEQHKVVEEGIVPYTLGSKLNIVDFILELQNHFFTLNKSTYDQFKIIKSNIFKKFAARFSQTESETIEVSAAMTAKELDSWVVSIQKHYRTRSTNPEITLALQDIANRIFAVEKNPTWTNLIEAADLSKYKDVDAEILQSHLIEAFKVDRGNLLSKASLRSFIGLLERAKERVGRQSSVDEINNALVQLFKTTSMGNVYLFFIFLYEKDKEIIDALKKSDETKTYIQYDIEKNQRKVVSKVVNKFATITDPVNKVVEYSFRDKSKRITGTLIFRKSGDGRLEFLGPSKRWKKLIAQSESTLTSVDVKQFGGEVIFQLALSDDNTVEIFPVESYPQKIHITIKDKAEITIAPIIHVAAPPFGGIDLSQEDAAMHIEKDANGGVKVDIDPALIARVEREGLSEIDPVIIGMRQANVNELFGAGVLTSATP